MLNIGMNLTEALEQSFKSYNDGEYVEVERLCSAILTVDPTSVNALHLLAMAQSQLGQANSALSYYDQVLAIAPNHDEALNNRGTILHELGRFDEALASYDRALEYRPRYPEALNNRGTALFELRRFDRALALNPHYAEALNNRGNTLQELGRLEEALENYNRALALRPDYAEALNNRGIALRALEQFAEALASFDRALALKPDYAEAYSNRGVALRELGRVVEALDNFDQALALNPRYPEALNNRGNALQELGRFREAMESYDRALALRADFPDCQVSRAFLLLLTGRFTEGWPAYEWRRRHESWASRSLPGPEWTKGGPLPRRLLLYSEQAFGDTIQFSRLASAVAAQGVEVVLEVQPALARLLSCLRNTKVIPRGAPLPAFDAQLPLMSVPNVLGLTPESLPPDTPYLFAEPDLVGAWARRLPSRGLRVGIVWHGKTRESRSIPLRAFAPLCDIPGLTLISLQKYDGTDELENLPPGMRVVTLGEPFDSGEDAFIDCAAVMMNLDLVISCDTATAHLAGALGRPAWIVLEHVSDWRWMIDRDDTPWYPTARLFRQRRRTDWDEVFQRIAGELMRMQASKGPARELLARQPRRSPDPSAVAPPGTVPVPVSFGELIDKITILEIKRERIGDRHRAGNIRAQLDLLTAALARFPDLPPRAGELVAELRLINQALWEIEDRIRACEAAHDFGERFIQLARGVYMSNDRRSAVKRELDELAGSAIVEEKLYSPTT